MLLSEHISLSDRDEPEVDKSTTRYINSIILEQLYYNSYNLQQDTVFGWQ